MGSMPEINDQWWRWRWWPCRAHIMA